MITEVNIKKHLDKEFKKFTKSIIKPKSIKSEDFKIRKLIQDYGFITGGAIASLLLKEDINDYDLYIKNVDACKKIVKYFINMIDKDKIFTLIALDFDEYINTHIALEKELEKIQDSTDEFFIKRKEQILTILDSDETVEEIQDQFNDKTRVKIYIPSMGTLSIKEKHIKNEYRCGPYPIHISSNAITLSNGWQIITRFVGTPDEVHKNFDFAHCTCYYDYVNDYLELPEKAIKSLLMKELVYQNSKYPLAALMRIRKFIKRGFKINAGEMLKIIWHVQELDLKNPKILEDQLMGVDILYFRDIICNLNEHIKQGDEIGSSHLFEMIDKYF